MKLPRLNSPNLWRDSITTGLAILAVFETALAISAISLDCVWGDYNWVIKLLLVLGLFFLIVAIVFLAKYYTTVDDIVIAHNTINGVFIDYHVEDLDDLKNAITNAPDNPKLKKRTRDGKIVYPLGRIITYKNYMLLAFTHFDNNEAHLSQKDYEDCLRIMWT